ncbi:MAG: MBOAT family protein [Crocosphaera sp.]
MLYNSYEFIFLFLPITLIIFYQLGQRNYQKIALVWIIVASFFFYARWNPAYLMFLLGSLVVNYSLGRTINSKFQTKLSKNLMINERVFLILGIVFNLGLLAYFKYANFFIESLNGLVGSNWTLKNLILPLGISFITFEQIAYLVDTYKGKIKDHDLIHYCLFISFFPQLISGPIVRYKELAPQLKSPKIFRFDYEDFSVGLTIFSIGLFKKVIIADNLTPHISLIYGAINQDVNLSFVEAWTGILAHTLRLYFDFSGYSDMAIGVARMFGIKLPLNFDSPYKTTNISQFWSHWHMTLTRFFRDYLYLPLSRWLKTWPLGKGQIAQQRATALNTFIGLSVTGLWHGAGWNFLAWGSLHGIYFIVYQQWRDFLKSKGNNLKDSPWWSQLIGWFLTFFAWMFALVLTRTENIHQTSSMWGSMLGFNGISLPTSLENNFSFLRNFGFNFSGLIPNFYVNPSEIILLIAILLLIVLFTPNTQQWMGQYKPAVDYYAGRIKGQWKANIWKQLQWKPSSIFAFISSFLLIISLFSLYQEQPFIYFQY